MSAAKAGVRETKGDAIAAPAAPSIQARREILSEDGFIGFPLCEGPGSSDLPQPLRTAISALENSHGLDFNQEVGVRQPAHFNGRARRQTDAEIVVPDIEMHEKLVDVGHE